MSLIYLLDSEKNFLKQQNLSLLTKKFKFATLEMNVGHVNILIICEF